MSRGAAVDAAHLGDLLPASGETARFLRRLGEEPDGGKESTWWATIGITSVKRQKGEYLRDTLIDLLQRMQRVDDVVYVVHLADNNSSRSTEWREEMEAWIKATFPLTVALGRLHVIHAPQERYPPIPYDQDVYPVNFSHYPEYSTEDPGGYNDTSDRVRYRSKQNIDVAFLLHYCAYGVAPLSGRTPAYYLMLEESYFPSWLAMRPLRARAE